MKVLGDGCVGGYVRFKRVKPCKGYKAAENRAALHLSKIIAGRPLEDGGYAAVVRLRLLPFLIPLAAFLLIFGILRSVSTKALVTEEPASEHIIEPQTEPATAEVLQNEYAGLYISVPGYTDFRVNASERSVCLYNPPSNECVLRYCIYIRDELVAATEMLAAGETAELDFYDRLAAGGYTARLVAEAYSTDGKTRFNSVSQQVTLLSE
ncbi:MAG: hypothetical protein NC223_00510 [Butyrivibrio sp.]|nr:hypothetical protein [Butyrivibrio sp.]